MSEETKQQIIKVYEGLKALQLIKNELYNDSALRPLGIFCKDSSDIQIRSRLDDKLSRVKNSTELRRNDCADIIGYVVLLMISEGWTEFEDLVD